MDSKSIAEMIAAWLEDRDDIASAAVLGVEETPTIGIETQGGETYFVTVESS